MFHPVSPDTFAIALFAALLLMAAWHDVAAYRIPNRISAAVAMLYPAHVLAHPAAVDWLAALMVAAIVLAVGFGLFAIRVFGAGDVKLLAAASLWAGPADVLVLLFVTALVGGVLALVVLSPLRMTLADAYVRLGGAPANMFTTQTLPYGVAIAAGGLIVAAERLAV